MKSVKQDSSLGYVLRALVPYTEANLKLAFKPQAFFNDLAKVSGKAEGSLRNALTKAKHQNLLAVESGKVKLKKEAKRMIDRFEELQATPLRSGYMLVLFDIPQSHDKERRLFVRELKALRFKQIQKSVWANDHDNRDVVLDIISELRIGKFVAVTLTHPVFGFHYFEK